MQLGNCNLIVENYNAQNLKKVLKRYYPYGVDLSNIPEQEPIVENAPVVVFVRARGKVGDSGHNILVKAFENGLGLGSDHYRIVVQESSTSFWPVLFETPPRFLLVSRNVNMSDCEAAIAGRSVQVVTTFDPEELLEQPEAKREFWTQLKQILSVLGRELS